MIRFNCKLKSHGWALAVVGDGHSELSVTASYLSDALSDFVAAIERLFETEPSECIWIVEPGQFCWKFSRENSRCTVQVFLNNESEPAFSADDDLVRFSSEVNNAFQKLLDHYGEQGYLDKWGYPFPENTHRKLARRIDLERENS